MILFTLQMTNCDFIYSYTYTENESSVIVNNWPKEIKQGKLQRIWKNNSKLGVASLEPCNQPSSRNQIY